MNGYTASTANIDEWTNHFKLMAQGKLKPNKHQLFLLNKNTETKPEKNNVQLKLVTPVAQAVEIASSDLKNLDSAPTDADPISHFPKENLDISAPTKKPRGRPKTSTTTKLKNKPKKPIKSPKQWEKFL